MKLALVALVSLCGCDALFDLHRIEITTGSNTPDAPMIYLDAPADAANCGMHDEDSDGLFDKCDPCPTVSDVGDMDMDQDGIGDTCDPDQGPQNTIDAFYSFQNGVGVSGTGDTYPNDTLRLAAGGNVVTVKTFTNPEVIDVTIVSLNAGNAAQIIANAGGNPTMTCEVSSSCGSSPTCVTLTSNGTSQVVALSFAVTELSSLILDRTDAGNVRCSVNDHLASHTASKSAGTIPSGKIELSSIGGAATFANAIVYTLQ